ncbi:hypothetical protein KY289_023077 [Solanum tuberosum]|nr:hypothetical protein KY289_023077 [Solanum tuberosum]
MLDLTGFRCRPDKKDKKKNLQGTTILISWLLSEIAKMILGQSSNSNRGGQPEISQSMEAKHGPSRRRTKIDHKNGSNMGILSPTSQNNGYIPLAASTTVLHHINNARDIRKKRAFYINNRCSSTMQH